MFDDQGTLLVSTGQPGPFRTSQDPGRRSARLCWPPPSAGPGGRRPSPHPAGTFPVDLCPASQPSNPAWRLCCAARLLPCPGGEVGLPLCHPGPPAGLVGRRRPSLDDIMLPSTTLASSILLVCLLLLLHTTRSTTYISPEPPAVSCPAYPVFERSNSWKLLACKLPCLQHRLDPTRVGFHE